MDNNKKPTLSYDLATHRLGRISTIIMIFALLAVPICTSIIYGVKVDLNKTTIAFFSAFSLFGIVGVTEFLSYAPVLGAGGMYLSFITGNIGNMKLPAALSSIKLANVEPGTKEGEIISVIAIAISSLVTTAIVLIGMFFLGLILPLLQSPTLKPAFDNLMPALMGALATPYFIKSFKVASLPCLIAAIMTLVMGYATVARYQSFLLPVFLVLAIGWSYVLYKKDNKKSQTTNKSL